MEGSPRMPRRPRERQSPRERPAKAPLSGEAVIAAGLQVLREKGIEGVTMRAVAAALDTGAASLYVYFPNRRALLDAMFDAVVATIDIGPEPDPARWREQLVALLNRIVERMDEHPGIARVPLANPPTGPAATRLAEHTLALLAAGGVDDRSAAWFIDVVFLFVNATAYETSIYVAEGSGEQATEERMREELGRLQSDQFPHFARLLPIITKGSGEERFNFGLELMINGLLHTEPPEI
jgi:AcrR family transcriptional regulator